MGAQESRARGPISTEWMEAARPKRRAKERIAILAFFPGVALVGLSVWRIDPALYVVGLGFIALTVGLGFLSIRERKNQRS